MDYGLQSKTVAESAQAGVLVVVAPLLGEGEVAKTRSLAQGVRRSSRTFLGRRIVHACATIVRNRNLEFSQPGNV